jgi:2-hydroxy-6-oxonona-2,4-dienedioate hydrolase
MNIIKYDNNQTILFVSGMFAGDWIWSRCEKQIAGTNHLVMADSLCSISHSFDQLVSEIVTNTSFYQKKITLVGSSLGGMLSLAVAREIPEKIEQVLIAGTAGFGKVDLQIKLKPSRADLIASEIMTMVCHDQSMQSQSDNYSVANEFRNNMRKIIGLIRDSNAIDGEAMLKSVKCPVHAIWGEYDTITPVSTVEGIFARLNMPLTVLKGCGHCPMYEQPTAFAAWVNACLAKSSQQLIEAA